MTSRPLLTRVAELIVMTGPIAQVGCARASSTVTWASSCFVRPRKGPPEAVTTSLRTSARVAGGQGLEEGRVLGVDRDDLAGLGEALDQRAAHDERLLVGQGEGAARLEGGQGRGEADGAGDAVQDGVAVGCRQPRGRVRADEDLGARLARAVLRGERLAQGRYDVLAGDRDRGHPQPVRLLGEKGDPAAVGGQAGDPEAVGVAQHEVDGLRADGPGGAEDHHVLRAVARYGVVDEVRVGQGTGRKHRRPPGGRALRRQVRALGVPGVAPCTGRTGGGARCGESACIASRGRRGLRPVP